MSWIVGNLNHYRKDKPAPAGAVYIGRKSADGPDSPLGNPFGLVQNKFNGLIIVPDPIRAYREYLIDMAQTDTPQRRELARLAAMPDSMLLCYCAPRPCHGDVVRRAIDWYRKTYEVLP